MTKRIVRRDEAPVAIEPGTMEIQVVQQDGEDLDTIAKELIGPKGLATYEVLGILPGEQWPTLRFHGTKQQLAMIYAKSVGSPVGRPPKEG